MKTNLQRFMIGIISLFMIQASVASISQTLPPVPQIKQMLYHEALKEESKKRLSKLLSFETLEFSFVQTDKLLGNQYKTTSTVEGALKLKKPNKVYLEKYDPDNYIFVSNGKKTIFYEQDLEQARIIQSSKLEPLSILLDDPENIFRNFYVMYDKSAKQKDKFILKPRTVDLDDLLGYKSITLVFKNDELSSITFKNDLDIETKIKVKELMMNHTIRNSYFKFKIPKGTDIIE